MMSKIKHYRRHILIAFLAFTAGGCATVPKGHGVAVPGASSLKEICARHGIHWRWDHVSQVATLTYWGSKAEVLVDSDIVLVDQDRVTLSAPVRIVRSAVVVPSDFQTSVIDRLLARSQYQEAYTIPIVRKIVIDAGHGGRDPGAIGFDGVQEKGIVLDIAKRLQQILAGRGFQVIMTRDKDEFISLQERTEIASRAAADLFVSVHANSNPVRSVFGLEVYVSEDMRFDERNEEQRKTNHDLMFSGLSIARGSKEVEKIVADMLYGHKQSRAEILAGKLSHHVESATKTKNRGVKRSRFYVVRNTLVPALLVEVGFLTNPQEAKWLQTESYQQKEASGLAESIVDYANGR